MAGQIFVGSLVVSTTEFDGHRHAGIVTRVRTDLEGGVVPVVRLDIRHHDNCCSPTGAISINSSATWWETVGTYEKATPREVPRRTAWEHLLDDTRVLPDPVVPFVTRVTNTTHG